VWGPVDAQLSVGVMLQYGALPTNYPDPDPEQSVDKSAVCINNINGYLSI